MEIYKSMIRKGITSVIFLSAVFFFYVYTAQIAVAQEGYAYFDEADALFRERADTDKAYEALRMYRIFYKVMPDNPEASWRLSMACYFIGFNVLKDNEQKKKIFAEGRDAGLESLERNPASAEAHFWTAVNMTLYGEAVGVIKMLFTLKTIKKHLNKCVKIDPSYAYGGGYRILGQIYEALPGILGGSREKAKENYEKAIEAAPDEPLNYMLIAKLYEKEYDDKEKALYFIEKGLSLPGPEYFRYESFKAIDELKELKSLYTNNR